MKTLTSRREFEAILPTLVGGFVVIENVALGAGYTIPRFRLSGKLQEPTNVDEADIFMWCIKISEDHWGPNTFEFPLSSVFEIETERASGNVLITLR